jgi:hypothetical protein
MASDGRVRLTIELEHGGPAPAGTLHGADHSVAAFDGWLQLLGALRDAIPAQPQEAATSSGKAVPGPQPPPAWPQSKEEER